MHKSVKRRSLVGLKSDTLPNQPNLTNICCSEIVSDLNDVLGTAYKPTSKTTSEYISGRMKEGFTIEEICKA